ncbi:Uncharacterized membrane protein YbhN, UPF0104 family [Prevotella aff. ruminicola Tc2-24]|uniref:Uncharacterized membrane protein YbhN, UPF0104 family n=1 Tax=Prevotella aff. ruminicola Tc2-24 TaxID=81582 RepID=A0A1I0Q1S8_9BACT|nr:lysylphosphatidylglycerol synthase transmembrane domain-containing protein [Prevotella aff. ruminicola Tc2-24]SEW20919.1 Uncharacterized membrane protein YbhN, UPF0104 family [Prevotella aff. ruminicola Tc2-24]
MKKRYQNAFFAFGLVVLIVMVTQLDFRQVWEGVNHAGYWFLAVILLWGILYIANTYSWYLIIDSIGNEQHVCRRHHIGFWWLYKITVSGFALNYATPGGLMGGEPYRIMSLSPKIGTQRASSSVILYVMTHIYSHFWLWLLASLLYVTTQPMTPFMAVVLTLVVGFCILAVWFFTRGYKKGIAMTGMNILRHFPMIRRWAQPFFERNQEKLATVDGQIAALHNQNPRTFVAAVLLELSVRIASALEIFFILLVILPYVNFIDCILVYAFTTLFANIFFFMPLQLGGREGGFLMSTGGLGMTARSGIFVALIVRVRELIWTAIGLLLIKFDKKEK